MCCNMANPAPKDRVRSAHGVCRLRQEGPLEGAYLLPATHGPTHPHAATHAFGAAVSLLSGAAGGLLAAPLAPHLVQRIEPRRLGMLVGAFICLTNVRVLL